MSTNDDQTAKDMLPPANRCEGSFDDHLADIINAFVAKGLGVGCETTYQALLVVAEAARQVNGFAYYNPSPEAVKFVARANKAKVAAAAQRLFDHLYKSFEESQAAMPLSGDRSCQN